MRMKLHAHGPPLLSAVSHTDTATTGMAKTQQHDLMTHSGIETPLPVGAMAVRLARVQAFAQPGVDVAAHEPPPFAALHADTATPGNSIIVLAPQIDTND